MRYTKTVTVITQVGLALLLSFSIIFAGLKFQKELAEKYPPVDCDNFYDTYGPDLLNFAYLEYSNNKQLASQGQSTNFFGYLQCFCNKEQALGKPGGEPYRTADTDPAPICEEYRNYMLLVLIIGQGITLFLVVVNKILAIMTIKLIIWIGHDTYSEQFSKITNGVLIAQYFNTAIVFLLVNANLSETVPYLAPIFNGGFTDYNFTWYSQVGFVVVQTVMLEPWINIFIQIGFDVMQWALQRLDQSCTRDPE